MRYLVRLEFPLYGAFQESFTFRPDLSRTLSSLGVSGTSWIIRLMMVSSLPKALVATQVKVAVSVLSVRRTLIVDRTPSFRISSFIVYLGTNIHYILCR